VSGVGAVAAAAAVAAAEAVVGAARAWLGSAPALPPLPGLSDGIVGTFARVVYGRTPTGGRLTGVTEPQPPETVLDGAAVRRRLVASIACPDGTLPLDVLAHVPTGATDPAPVVVALNFTGNQDSIDGDQSGRWPFAQIVAAGFAVLTADYRQVEPDDPQPARTGVRALFPARETDQPAWGAIGAWAWGMSRLLDVAERIGVDTSRSIALGHSRLGKAALWAAAQDRRFGVAVSNDSGCAGASLFRHPGGEDVAAITTAFPHWFVPSLARYAHREDELPVDQHQLLAAIAPRRVLVLSAQDDQWADPVGEAAAVLAAAPAFHAGGIGHHVREGGHDLTADDWMRALDFAGGYAAGCRVVRPLSSASTSCSASSR
jgi:hypothetical protein